MGVGVVVVGGGLSVGCLASVVPPLARVCVCVCAAMACPHTHASAQCTMDWLSHCDGMVCACHFGFNAWCSWCGV